MKNDIDNEDAEIMHKRNRNNKSLAIEKTNKKLALFTKRYVHSKSWGTNTYHNYNQVFSAGSYTTDQILISELVENKADVEIYESVE